MRSSESFETNSYLQDTCLIFKNDDGKTYSQYFTYCSSEKLFGHLNINEDFKFSCANFIRYNSNNYSQTASYFVLNESRSTSHNKFCFNCKAFRTGTHNSFNRNYGTQSFVHCLCTKHPLVLQTEPFKTL